PDNYVSPVTTSSSTESSFYRYASISIFFFLMIPPPPISTLFPYTSLFRSQNPAKKAVGFHHKICTTSQPMTKRENARAITNEALDRKSTRLNSSHRTISYAVFCLKKKIHLAGRKHESVPYNATHGLTDCRV